MPPATVEVGKLEIVNINLNKQFISLHKVITKHRHKTPQENFKAETTKTCENLYKINTSLIINSLT